MAPIGVQTPSTTTRAHRLRQPLESPAFPPTHYADVDGSASTPSSEQQENQKLNHGLSDRHLREIQTIFEIFDPTLSGYVDVPTFEVMVRSLGFRMTSVEIAGMVELIYEERQEQQQQQQHGLQPLSDAANSNERRKIDLSMATQIIAQRGYVHRSVENEMQMYFRIFDGGNKGYITLEDLQRVRQEVQNYTEEGMDYVGSATDITADNSSGLNDGNIGMVGDDTLQAMIQQFDNDHDGVINFDEFKNILEPVLS